MTEEERLLHELSEDWGYYPKGLSKDYASHDPHFREGMEMLASGGRMSYFRRTRWLSRWFGALS